jgi:hypothetical protein
MLLLTIVLLFQLSCFVDMNASLPLVGNHVQAQHRTKEQRT